MKYLFFVLVLSIATIQANLEIKSFDLFKGDSHGDFKGDIVLCLSDGSRWKAHPEERAQATDWNIGASVSISPRTEFYFFKREHKLLLNNLNTGESIKAMLILYDENPLTISHVSTYTLADYVWEWVPVWDVFRGEFTYQYQYTCRPILIKDLILSDGTEWTVRKHLDSFVKGAKVYVGTDPRPFIITGREREAVWLFRN